MGDKKQRFVVISDIHGFYDEMIDALNKVNFNPETDHLITCGDHWDRGSQPVEVMRYLMKLPHKTLILGNHEELFQTCCQNGYWQSHDIHNGTFDSICELGGAGGGRSFDECCIIAEQRAKPFLDSMVDYFETEHYVFVHSWIPVNCNDGLPAWYKRHRKYSKKEDWREAHHSEWENARWMNPLEMAMNGYGIEKTIVCGHWHCSAGWALKNKTFDEFGENACFDPYYYEDKLIMIDACTAHTGKVNVLVLEDNFMENAQ